MSGYCYTIRETPKFPKSHCPGLWHSGMQRSPVSVEWNAHELCYLSQPVMSQQAQKPCECGVKCSLLLWDSLKHTALQSVVLRGTFVLLSLCAQCHGSPCSSAVYAPHPCLVSYFASRQRKLDLSLRSLKSKRKYFKLCIIAWPYILLHNLSVLIIFPSLIMAVQDNILYFFSLRLQDVPASLWICLWGHVLCLHNPKVNVWEVWLLLLNLGPEWSCKLKVPLGNKVSWLKIQRSMGRECRRLWLGRGGVNTGMKMLTSYSCTEQESGGSG